MTDMRWTEALVAMRPCEDALTWARSQDTAEAAWTACERGDWMLWLLGKLSGAPESDGRKKLVLAACECARLALPYGRDGKHSPRIAIETAESWARGEGATISQVRHAAAAAYAAAYAAAAVYAYAYAADAAEAAANAAEAAYFAAYTTDDDADRYLLDLAAVLDLAAAYERRSP